MRSNFPSRPLTWPCAHGHVCDIWLSSVMYRCSSLGALREAARAYPSIHSWTLEAIFTSWCCHAYQHFQKVGTVPSRFFFGPMNLLALVIELELKSHYHRHLNLLVFYPVRALLQKCTICRQNRGAWCRGEKHGWGLARYILHILSTVWKFHASISACAWSSGDLPRVYASPLMADT